MSKIERTTGTARVVEPDDTRAEATQRASDLLPEPQEPSVGPEGLIALLIEANRASREMNRSIQQAQAHERASAQADEVEAMRDQASSILVGGIVTGAIQIGSAGLQVGGAYSTTARSKDLFAAGTTANGAVAGLAQALTQWDGKGLEADAKTAAARASTAKDIEDEAKQAAREQRDMDQATLQAYQAIVGSQAQTWQVINGQRG